MKLHCSLIHSVIVRPAAFSRHNAASSASNLKLIVTVLRAMLYYVLQALYYIVKRILYYKLVGHEIPLAWVKA